MDPRSFRLVADGALIEAFIEPNSGDVCISVVPADGRATNSYAALSPLTAYMLGEILIAMSEPNGGVG